MRVSGDLLEHVNTLANEDEEDKPEGVSLEQTPTERKLHFHSVLTVRFNNSTTQVWIGKEHKANITSLRHDWSQYGPNIVAQ